MYCDCIAIKPRYKLVSVPGMTAIIIHGQRILLLKRRNVPIILNAGIWAFLSGGRERGERYIDTAYREIREESGIDRHSLTLLFKTRMLLTDRKRRIVWPNWVFVFRSDTGKVRLDYENSGYRWATINQIEKEINYTNIFINHRELEKTIRGYVYGQEDA